MCRLQTDEMCVLQGGRDALGHVGHDGDRAGRGARAQPARRHRRLQLRLHHDQVPSALFCSCYTSQHLHYNYPFNNKLTTVGRVVMSESQMYVYTSIGVLEMYNIIRVLLNRHGDT